MEVFSRAAAPGPLVSPDAPAAHVTHFQAPKMRLIRFSRVCSHVHGTEGRSDYHQGRQDASGNANSVCEMAVRLERFENTALPWLSGATVLGTKANMKMETNGGSIFPGLPGAGKLPTPVLPNIHCLCYERLARPGRKKTSGYVIFFLVTARRLKNYLQAQETN